MCSRTEVPQNLEMLLEEMARVPLGDLPEYAVQVRKSGPGPGDEIDAILGELTRTRMRELLRCVGKDGKGGYADAAQVEQALVTTPVSLGRWVTVFAHQMELAQDGAIRTIAATVYTALLGMPGLVRSHGALHSAAFLASLTQLRKAAGETHDAEDPEGIRCSRDALETALRTLPTVVRSIREYNGVVYREFIEPVMALLTTILYTATPAHKKELSLFQLVPPCLHALLHSSGEDKDGDSDGTGSSCVEVLRLLLPILTANPMLSSSIRKSAVELKRGELVRARDQALEPTLVYVQSRSPDDRTVASLLQHVFLLAPERAEGREIAAYTACMLCAVSEPGSVRAVLQRIASHSRAASRLALVETCGMLLTDSVAAGAAAQRQGGNGNSLEQLCIAMLVERSRDKIPQIRAKALLMLVSALESDAERMPLVQAQLGTTESLASRLATGLSDEKSQVRRAALSGIGLSLRWSSSEPSVTEESSPQIAKTTREDYLRLCGPLCVDPVTMVRKAAYRTCTDLLLLQDGTEATEVMWSQWFANVLPGVAATDLAVVEACLGSLEEVVVGTLRLRNSTSPGPTPSHRPMFRAVHSLEDELRRCLRYALAQLSAKNAFHCQAAASLEHAAVVDQEPGAWLLLAELAMAAQPSTTASAAGKSDCQSVCQWLQWEPLYDAVQQLDHDYRTAVDTHGKEGPLPPTADNDALPDRLGSMLGHALVVLRGWMGANRASSRAVHMSASSTESLRVFLKERIASFVWPPSATVAAMDLIGDMEGCLPTSSWVQDTANQAEAILAAFVEPRLLAEADSDRSTAAKDPSAYDLEKLTRVLFAIGELTRAYIPAANGSTGGGGPHRRVKMPARLVTYLQAVCSPFGQAEDVTASDRMRAHAYLALGKAALTDESLAKSAAPMLAKELETSASEILRNNALVVLCDLSVRFTAITEIYSVSIALALKDRSALVKRHALLLQTRLLQEDFVKWRPIMFYRFASVLADPSKEVQQFASLCLETLLASKGSAVLHAQFVDFLFFMHDCRAHPLYNQQPVSSKERTAFTFAGDSRRPDRLHVLHWILSHMADEQRFHVFASLNQEILAAFLEDKMAWSSESEAVLKDALLILTSAEARLNTSTSGSRFNPQQQSLEDEQTLADTAVVAAQGRLLGKMMQKNVVENILPVALGLKEQLEARRSPLQGLLWQFVRLLVAEFPAVAQDLMSSNRQLAAEIRHAQSSREGAAVRQPLIQSASDGGAATDLSPSSCTKQSRALGKKRPAVEEEVDENSNRKRQQLNQAH